jgi:SAM-dependent methyltransferase
VIEAACGTGRHTGWLAEGAAGVVALDFSEGMLARARARVSAPTVRFARHDLRAPWPVEAGAADLVVMMLVLEHIEAVAPVYAEAARALRPGGRLFSCEFHPVRQLLGRTAEYTDPTTGRPARVAAFAHEVSEYVRAGLDAGFRVADLGEWRDDGAPPATPPRLLTLDLVRE